MTKHSHLLFTFIMAATLTLSCTGLRPGGQKGISKNYETFYVGTEGTQYFIKPMKFEGVDGEDLSLDFTFRYKKVVEGDARLAFSLNTDEVIHELESVSIESASRTYEVSSLELLFNERERKDIESRFAGVLPLTELHDLFEGSDWTMTITRNGKSSQYLPSNQSKKVIADIKKEVFDLMLLDT